MKGCEENGFAYNIPMSSIQKSALLYKNVDNQSFDINS